MRYSTASNDMLMHISAAAMPALSQTECAIHSDILSQSRFLVISYIGLAPVSIGIATQPAALSALCWHMLVRLA